MRALITGASSGIGLATAQKMAEAGIDLILIARREDRLQTIKKDLEKRFQVKVVISAFDIRSSAAVEQFASENETVLSEVDILLNNAGLAKGLDKMDEGKVADWDEMIDTNVKGLLYMTHAVLPHMLKNKRGHIVNLGSVAGRWVYPKGAVYCASKFAVAALTEGLRLDLNGTGLRVTNVEPGMVETEFSKVRLGNEESAKAVYRGFTPLSASDIADTILWCVQRPAHINIQELVIYPTDQASVQLVNRR